MRVTNFVAALYVLALLTPGAAQGQSGQDTLLPGVLDILVLEGSFIPDDCKWSRPPSDERFETCVVFPPDHSIEMLIGYKSILESSGWTYRTEADPYFLFDHAIEDSECIRRLTVTGSTFATISEYLEARRSGRLADLQGVLYFQVNSEPVCDRQRN